MWRRRDRVVKSALGFTEGKRSWHKIGAGLFGVVNGRCRRFVAGPILRVGRFDVNTYLLSPPKVHRVILPIGCGRRDDQGCRDVVTAGSTCSKAGPVSVWPVF